MTVSSKLLPADTLPGVGTLIKEWRTLRRSSQMDLALDVRISPRHLSFVETGRSRPSVEVLLAIAAHLEVPLRMRNTWLLAAGYAPCFSEQSLTSAKMAQIHAALDKLLSAHDPYPGVALDGRWNVVLANQAAQRMVALLPESLRQPPINMFRASLHPDGFAAMTQNFDEWGGYLLHELQKLVLQSRDTEIMALAKEVAQYPNVASLANQPTDGHSLLIPCVLSLGGHQLSLFTTMTSFGTPRDITLAELSVELFYPSDAQTDTRLHQLAGTP